MLYSPACIGESADTQLREEGGSRREGAGGREGMGFISAWQILNSKRTANTLSGTDSSHLVKKLWSQILLEKEK